MARILKTVVLVVGVTVFLVPGAAIAAPPPGFGYEGWTVENGVINAPCPPGAMSCANPSVADPGLLQRLVRDSDGKYYYQTIVTDSTAGAAGGSAPSELNFFNESYVKVTYGYASNSNKSWGTIASYQRIKYETARDIDGNAVTTPTEDFLSTFEITTGELYDSQFDPFGTIGPDGIQVALEMYQVVSSEEKMMAGDDGLAFIQEFDFYEDQGHNSSVLAIAQDVYQGDYDGVNMLESLETPGSDRERFRMYEIENATGCGTAATCYFELDTNFDGSIDPATERVAWADGDTVGALWWGQSNTTTSADPYTGTSMGHQKFEVNGSIFDDDTEGSMLEADSPIDTGSWYYPPTPNPFVDEDGVDLDPFPTSATFDEAIFSPVPFP